MSRAERKNTKDFRLPVNAGTNTDGFSENVPLLTTENFVMLPDGSGLGPRQGYEIRRNDGIGYGSNRKLIYFVSNPPDIDYGDLIVLTNTRDGRQFIEHTEVVRTTNTGDLENPMSMPDLPGTEPVEPDIAVPLYYTDFNETTMSVMLYDPVGKTLHSPATLTGADGGYGTYLFRTETYLVSYQATYGGRTQAKLRAWELATLAANPTGSFAPDVDIVAYDMDGTFQNYPGVYAYRGDVVYVIENFNTAGPTFDFQLVKIDIAAGTVTQTPITGLPSDFQYCGMNSYEPSGVDSNGDLWLYDAASSPKRFMKVNPATAAVTATEDVPGSLIPLAVFAPQADGSMIYKDLFTGGLISVSGDLVTHTPLSSTAFVLVPDNMRNGVLDMKYVTGASGGVTSAFVLDMATPATGTEVPCTGLSLPFSVHGGTKFVGAAQTGESAYQMLSFDVDAMTLTSADDLSLVPGIAAMPDVFGWVLQNIQGTRL